MNEWATKEVFESHGYHKNLEESCKHHDEFAFFLSGESGFGNRKYENVSILDIGCCNGRVLNSLSNNSIRKYHGIDINPHAIQVAKEHWKHRDDVSFDVFDPDEQDLRSLNLEQFDVVYLDSTITFFQNYKEILETLLESVDTVFCNRTLWMTNIYLDCEDSRLKELPADMVFEFETRWNGMREECKRVFLNEGYIEELTYKYDKLCYKFREDIYDGNWYDFYSFRNNDTTKDDAIPILEHPLIQQQLRDDKTMGAFITRQFEMARYDNTTAGVDTGRGVWFKLPGSNEILHGGDVLTDDTEKAEDFREDHDQYCSLNKTKNRKLIFVSHSS